MTEENLLKKALPCFLRPMLLLLAAIWLTGCGKVSAAKLAEVDSALAELTAARTHAIDIYDTLYDDSLYAPLQEASKQVDAFAETNAGDMTEEEIDEQLLPSMRELTGVFRELQEKLDATAAAEEEDRRSHQGKKSVTFHVINQSGVSFSSLRWVEESSKGQTERLAIPSPLADSETLAGVTITVPTGVKADLYLYAEIEEGSPVAYDVAETVDLEAGTLYYLVLSPDGNRTLTTNPADISPMSDKQEEEEKDPDGT